jgi:hypothetical protein
VLRSFRDKDTEAIWLRKRSRRLDGPTQRIAWCKLAMEDYAKLLVEMIKKVCDLRQRAGASVVAGGFA